MSYYSDHPCTSSFPVVLVKTKSDFMVRSAETGLWKWTLVVAVTSVDSYPFLAFSDVTCHLEDTGIGVFWLHCTAWCKETKLGSSNEEASSSAGKNTRIILVPCCAYKCVPIAISNGVDIFKVPGCHLLWQMSSQWESQKLLQGLVSPELIA